MGVSDYPKQAFVSRRWWAGIMLWGIWLVSIARTGYAAPCPDFTWQHPPEMRQPDVLHEVQKALAARESERARRLLSTYLDQVPEGLFAEGARFALAWLPGQHDDRENGFLAVIDRLEQLRKLKPHSPYAPWALCWEGELYRQAGWHVEANAMFQELVETYPASPLVGGALLGAGLSYLDNQQYLEAALVFRRIVEEPRWAAYHLEGALGLADATALSGAWPQAHYWYQVVEAEAPHMIRASVRSTYGAALAEWHVGDRRRSIRRLLLTVNLYPRDERAGDALNRIGSYLLAQGHEALSLWFFHEAAVRFDRRAPGRRAQAAITRWVVSFLSRRPSEDERNRFYDRLDQLGIYVPLNWDGVIETALVLKNAPEPELVDEAKLWLAQGYEALDDWSAAVAAYAALASSFHEPRWGKVAQTRLKHILMTQVRAYYARQAWPELIAFHHAHRTEFLVLPPDRELMLMIAEAYQQVHLPERALAWYSEVLREYPHHAMAEEIMARQMLVALELPDRQRALAYATAYREAFPHGQWRGEAAWILGLKALDEHQVSSAIDELTTAVQHARDRAIRVRALRQRASAYRAIGQLEQAIQDYRQLVDMPDSSIDDQVVLADLLYEQGAFAEAARRYTNVLDDRVSPDVAVWVQFRLGLCHQEMGNRSRAIDLLKRVLVENIEDPDLEKIIHRTARAALNVYQSGMGNP
ncbi:MAG: hypothetical protein D6690_06520 [Nitrospirae bacterium]|nr:MAG: hypothetical protein D6690_06520 [Nitrospirota bacterium]